MNETIPLPIEGTSPETTVPDTLDLAANDAVVLEIAQDMYQRG